jgi:hypothetical protein
VSLNEQRQVKHTQSTGLKSLSLFKNEEVDILSLLFHSDHCIELVSVWLLKLFRIIVS